MEVRSIVDANDKPQVDKPSEDRKTKCCSSTTREGEGGFMNMFCKALGCCGLFSACHEPQTSQTKRTKAIA
ncbi:hypothetical protein QQP08_005436 [Theobroma cacao]|nr:hypothetical protein QQP08_005436 [Theobroma cacao]